MNKDQDRINRIKKGNLRLVERFDSDDYSRYAGPDYREYPFEIGQEETRVTTREEKHFPSGISGKKKNRNSSLEDFFGKGPKNYIRKDERIYEEACELLMRHRDIDASEIAVNVKNGVVSLSGKIEGQREKKLAGIILEKLSGVRNVVNELMVFQKEENPKGPTAITRKDLGVT